MNDEKKKYYFINKCLFIMVIIATLFMGIGYAALNSLTLGVKGNLVALSYIKELMITASQVDNGGSETGEVLSYTGTLLNLNMKLSDTADSSITYLVTICNGTNDVYLFSGIVTDSEGLFYSNPGIVYHTTLEEGKMLEAGECVEFELTFEYDEGYYGTDGFDQTLDCYIKFEFDRVFNVTYENMGDTSNLPKYAFNGKSFSATLNGIDGPIEVKQNGSIVGTDVYNYNNYVFNVPNVTGDIHIRNTKYVLKNMVVNGSFENGLVGYELVGSPGTWISTPIALYGSTAYYRVPSARFDNYLSYALSWENGHTYYYFMYTICTSNQSLVSDVHTKGGSIKITSVPNLWKKGSVLYTANFSGLNTISINFDHISDNVILDGIGVIDLTETFGLGYEPDLAWCDQNINYFDGEMVIYK